MVTDKAPSPLTGEGWDGGEIAIPPPEWELYSESAPAIFGWRAYFQSAAVSVPTISCVGVQEVNRLSQGLKLGAMLGVELDAELALNHSREGDDVHQRTLPDCCQMLHFFHLNLIQNKCEFKGKD